MAWFIGQSILIIVAAFLLGILVGWLIWGRMWRRPSEPAERAAQSEQSDAAETRTVSAEPEAEVEPEPVISEPALGEPVIAAEPVVAAEPVEAEAVAAEPVAAESTEVEPVAVEPVVAEPAEVEPVAVEPVAAEPVGAQGVAAEPVAVALTAEPDDDLERIEGIGPKMAGALHKAGIRTYSQLAGADEPMLRQAIEADGLRFAPSIVTWSRQAKLLADGDEEGFADLTRRLVAGRDEGRE